MKSVAAILALTLFFSVPAIADVPSNVTLILENDAGMVTQVSDLTQRECDGLLALLAGRNVSAALIAGTSLYVGGNAWQGSSAPPTRSATSALTKSRCTVPSDKP